MTRRGCFLYPAIKKLYWSETSGVEITGLIDINDIIYQIKNKTIHANDILEFHVDQETIRLKAKWVKNIVDVLGTTDLRVYFQRPITPLLFIDKKTGNKALSVSFINIKKGE